MRRRPRKTTLWLRRGRIGWVERICLLLAVLVLTVGMVGSAAIAYGRWESPWTPEQLREEPVPPIVCPHEWTEGMDRRCVAITGPKE